MRLAAPGMDCRVRQAAGWHPERALHGLVPPARMCYALMGAYRLEPRAGGWGPGLWNQPTLAQALVTEHHLCPWAGPTNLINFGLCVQNGDGGGSSSQELSPELQRPAKGWLRCNPGFSRGRGPGVRPGSPWGLSLSQPNAEEVPGLPLAGKGSDLS